VARIEASLVDAGFKVCRDSVSGRQALIGRTGGLRLGRPGGLRFGCPGGLRFGWRQVFVLVAVFKAGMAGREHLDRYLDEAGQYAATVKGGLATGAAAVAVAVVEAGGDGAVDATWARAALEAEWWARTPPGPRPAAGRAPAFPALVDLAAGRLVCPDQPGNLRAVTIRAVGLDPG
jgi:hypothetical protein